MICVALFAHKPHCGLNESNDTASFYSHGLFFSAIILEIIIFCPICFSEFGHVTFYNKFRWAEARYCCLSPGCRLSQVKVLPDSVIIQLWNLSIFMTAVDFENDDWKIAYYQYIIKGNHVSEPYFERRWRVGRFFIITWLPYQLPHSRCCDNVKFELNHYLTLMSKKLATM